MAERTGNQWADASWTPYLGCLPCSTGCKSCYVPLNAATLHQSTGVALYSGVAKKTANGKQYTFTGKLTVLPPEHPSWRWPLEWDGAIVPLLGMGEPSLIFCSGGGDLFIQGRPKTVIDQVIATIALSRHIGQILNRRADLMARYFLALPEERRARWQQRFWLGTSAENQWWFDQRWPPLRELAQQGWTTFVSIAPLIEPVRLPDDFLSFGDRVWCIASGEQRPGRRFMDPNWARSLRDQCRDARVPFFVKQMSSRARIPDDLMVRQFPARPSSPPAGKISAEGRDG